MRFLDKMTPFLAISSRERRKQVPVRLLLMLVLAGALYDAGLASWIPGWATLSLGVQLFEFWALSAFRDEREVGRFRAVCAILSTFLMALAHAALALLVWTTGDAVLASLGVMILAGGLMTNIASGIGSRMVFLIGGAPYLAAVGLMPLVMGVNGRFAGLALMIGAGVLFLGAILNVYGRVYATRQAEVAALAEAEARLEQAQAAMAERAAMAAIVSHELRTPVSAILAGAQVIRDGGAADRTEETADLIVDAGRLMTGMLNDLLDHSKMEAGALQVVAADFDASALVDDAARFWRASAEQKGLILQAVALDKAVWLKGDAFRLRQIVNNLMSNAVKFTPRGMIRLEAAVRDAEAGRRLRITITDQGPGIAPEAMERLFTPFAQGSAEVARTYGGTGLGLAVSRDLARAMGGDLTAESAPGGGARFVLDLELPRGEAVVAADMETSAAPDLGRRLRVLAVDDHEINRRTLALVLQPLNVDLSTASDGALALELLATRPFDVVLMDVNMPGMDGNEATRRLRGSGGVNASTPVIGFSAGSEEAHVAACRAAGMTDWLAKPLEPRKLYEALQRAVGTVDEGAAVGNVA